MSNTDRIQKSNGCSHEKVNNTILQIRVHIKTVRGNLFGDTFSMRFLDDDTLVTNTRLRDPSVK